MEEQRTTTLARILTRLPSRRDVFRALAASGIALSLTRLPKKADARKRKHKKRMPKKAKPNAFGCLEVGDPRKNAGQCCSGSCERKKCRAHDTGTCKQEGPGACTHPDPELLACNNTLGCICIRTTAGSNVCAKLNGSDPGDSQCADCQRDADCEALGFPPGTACAPASEGIGTGICATGMLCAIPCGADVSESASD